MTIYVGGVDIGSLSAKALVMDTDGNINWKIISTGPDSMETAINVMNLLLQERRLELKDISYIVSTGYGRVNVPFATERVTEITCHVRAAFELFPEVHTILDMGGQDCKVMRCNDNGRVVNFLLNDQCAAGTGRFVERVALALKLSLDQVGELSLQVVEEPVTINNTCAVFAERDIIKAMRDLKHPNDILAGAMEALTTKILSLLQRVGVMEALSVSGGIAKNIGVVNRIEKKLGLKCLISSEPQIMGALGAAFIAMDKMGEQLEHWFIREFLCKEPSSRKGGEI